MGILAFSALRSRRRIAKFYYYGVEYVSWVPGYIFDHENPEYAICSKESTYLRLYASHYGAEAAFVTNELIDFTRIDYLELEAENAGVDEPYNHSYLVLSVNKMGNYDIYDYRWLVFQGIAGKQIKIYDTRNITGSYYIRLHAYVAHKAYYSSDFRIYAVLESKG
jgi:hypothetical protein